ncbi:hypothetical protein GCM10027428_13280 [Haliea atlantica]|nr:hypothetical protein [Haliea sp.]|tara:strand:- start:2382 stop:3203 length:822 start_codon:yes stop_codon:yes gene_type:complete
MDMPIQNALAEGVLKILRPLARILLSHGMACGTFTELARRAFVDAAFEQLRREGHRPTVSSVSALTGLSRKETARLRDAAPEEDVSNQQRYSRAIRVISGWVNDPAFLDHEGQPAVLPMEGEFGSFTALVRQYSGDIPPVAMLQILQASNNVEYAGSKVMLRSRAYIPMATPLERIGILGTDVAELVQTIGHNLAAEPERRYFQRKVSNYSLPRAALPAFRDLTTRQSQELLEAYNTWLLQHETDSSEDHANPPAYVAVGIYYHEDSPGEVQS